MNKTISIANDFSKYPGGRYPSDSEHSGELFRESILIPALLQGGIVAVHLDGTMGYGSSFLEEAFGGLVRAGFSREELKQKLDIHSERNSLHEEIWHHIGMARQHDT